MTLLSSTLANEDVRTFPIYRTTSLMHGLPICLGTMSQVPPGLCLRCHSQGQPTILLVILKVWKMFQIQKVLGGKAMSVLSVAGLNSKRARGWSAEGFTKGPINNIYKYSPIKQKHNTLGSITSHHVQKNSLGSSNYTDMKCFDSIKTPEYLHGHTETLRS